MGAFSNYILSVICAAFVLGILDSIFNQKGSTGGLLKLIGGLFLAFTMLSPVVRMDFSGIWNFLEEYTVAGESAAAVGESMAEEEYRTIIKSETEAYILDKANVLGVTLAVEVTLSRDEVPVPVEAVLRGAVSPYAKQQLQQMMETELDIAKENQLWIG